MPSPSATLHLVTGDEELLVERAVRAVIADARVAEPAAELRRVRAAEVGAAELLDLVSPSLFEQARVIVLEGLNDAPADLPATLAGYLRDPADTVTLVAVHPVEAGKGSRNGKAAAEALRTAGATVTECPRITRPSEREAFVRAEVRRAGSRIGADAVTALIDTVGNDLRELAAAAGQLVADTGGADIDEPAVRRYHTGRAEVTGFTVAEHAVAGDRAAALEALRWGLDQGLPPVLVADALADAVRTIARVQAAGRGDPNQLAGVLGMPPWKIRRALGQARGWHAESLAAALREVAVVNADVKGVAADAGYALERTVLKLCAIRG